MRNRFFCPKPMLRGDFVELTGEEFHHAVRVARSRVGEPVELFDGRGRTFDATVSGIDRERIVFELSREHESSRESPLEIDLALALIDLARFEVVLQKATELGVRHFTPLLTDRTETRIERIAGKRERWERIVLEAVKQSGRAFIPQIGEPSAFADVLRESRTRFFFDADESPGEQPASPLDRCIILIGPEGGWSPEEIELARQNGCVFRKLGPRRLRAETAAIAATVSIAQTFGDLRS